MMVEYTKWPAVLGLILAIAPLSTMAASVPLSSNELRVELDRCRVEISTSDTQSPALRVLHVDGFEVPLESIGVLVRNNVVSVHDQQNEDPLKDLVFSFTLLPTQGLQIEGLDLDLTVTGSEIPANMVKDDQKPDQRKSEEGGCATPHLLLLSGGTAHVTGGSCMKIIASEADLSLGGTSQTLEIEATGDQFRIHDHHGKIILNAQEHASGVIVGNNGDLEVAMTQSRLTVEGGTGAIHSQFEDGSLDISGHNGRFEGSGSESEFQIQHSLMSLVRLTGTRIQARLFGGQGNIRATLEGGSLSIEDWAGRIDLHNSRGTTLDIDSVDGDFAFSILDGAGEIANVTGHTRGALTDSEMKFSRLKSIEITANSSQTTVKDVPQVTQLNILGGFLNYESSQVEGKPKIHLSAEATANIVIPQPCIVRCIGPGAKDSGNISVSGCEVRAPGQQWGARRRDAQPAIHLELMMQELTEVSVSGF